VFCPTFVATTWARPSFSSRFAPASQNLRGAQRRLHSTTLTKLRKSSNKGTKYMFCKRSNDSNVSVNCRGQQLSPSGQHLGNRLRTVTQRTSLKVACYELSLVHLITNKPINCIIPSLAARLVVSQPRQRSYSLTTLRPIRVFPIADAGGTQGAFSSHILHAWDACLGITCSIVHRCIVN
jgi:hypothetical protein